MNGWLANGVPIAAGVTALVLAAWLWIKAKRAWPRLTVVLIIAGVTAITGTVLGRWAYNAVNGVSTYASHLFSIWLGFGIAVVTLFAVWFVLTVVHDLWKGEVSTGTLVAAALAPLLVVAIPGPAGDLSQSAVAAVAGGVGQAIGALFGA